MTAPPELLTLADQMAADTDLDIGHLHDRLHLPSDASDQVRHAWTDYIGKEACAELSLNATLATLAEVVEQSIQTARLTYRRTRAAAYQRYIEAVLDESRTNTPDTGPAADGEPHCATISPSGRGFAWHCTRARGHKGSHVAHNLDGETVFSWDDPAPAERRRTGIPDAMDGPFDPPPAPAGTSTTEEANR